MAKYLPLALLMCFVGSVQAQYLETFSTANKGYLLNFANDFTAVDWTLSAWDLQPPAAFGRDVDDYFQTTAAGKLESIDLDQQVYWESPLINTTAAPTVSIKMNLTWTGFDSDVMANDCSTDWIRVEYSVNGGAYVMVPNVAGGGACATVSYPFENPGMSYDDNVAINHMGIAGGSSLQIRVRVFTNANAEIVTIDNVEVPEAGVTIGCAAPNLSTIVTQVGCSNPNSGAIDLTASAGNPPYTYAWSNGPTSQDNNGIPTGTYTVTVTDAAMCTATISATVGNAPALSLSTQVLDVTCGGTEDGEIDLIVSGGVPGYTYSWTGGATTQDLIGVGTGTYTVTVTDASGCTATTSATIGTLPMTAYNEQFNIANKGYLTNFIDDFSAVNWTMSPWTIAAFGRQTEDFFRTTGGQLVGQDFDQEVCWISPVIDLGTGTQFSVDLAWIGMDNDSTERINVNYSIDGGPYVTVPNVVGGGAGTIQYQIGGGGNNNGSTTVTQMGLSGSTIQIQVCGNINSDAESITIDNVSVPNSLGVYCPGPQPSIAITNVSCNGGSDGALDLFVTDGTPPYTYFWSTNATTEDISGLSAGTYTVTVTDVNGLTGTASATVTEPTALGATCTGGSVLCNGDTDGSVSVTASGGTPGYTYVWSSGGTTATETGLGAGTYTVTVTDANSCTATCSASVTEPTALAASCTGGSVLCNGDTDGSVSVTASGGTPGYSYQWSSGGTGSTETSLGAGTFTVTVTDTNGCTATCSATVTEPTPVGASCTGGSVLCNGDTDGSVSVSASGGTPGYSYAWSSGGTLATETGLGAGTYTVTVTDANGCTATCSATVTQPSVIDIGGDVIHVDCFGEATGAIDIDVSGGTPGYTYLWSNGATTEDINNLVAGIYTVTVTDANSCTNTIFGTVEQPTEIMLSTMQVNVLCNGASTGSIDLTPSAGTPGYTYAWTNGATTQDIAGLAAGSYTVTVTDANLCTKTISATITQPSALALSVTSTPACAGVNNGTVDLTVAGGTPAYVYAWSNGNQVEDLSGVGAGTYTVTVTDINQCTKTISATVAQSSTINLSTTSTNTCTGTSVGAINLTVTGGTPGFTYAWSNGAATEDIMNLAAGTYTVTVTDANTCTKTISATVVANPVPTVNTIGNQALCAGSSTTAVNFTGTPAGVVFNWTNNQPSIGLAAAGNGNIPSFVALNATNAPVVATITVTPQITAGGTTCNGTSKTFTITVNPVPAVFMVTGGGLVCTTDIIGVPVGLSGSQTNVNYQLFLNGNPVGLPVAGTGAAISFGTQLGLGNYTVVATHTQGGCVSSMSGTVTIASFNCSAEISDPCVCLNNATTLTNGQFGEQVKINAPATQVWTITAVTGLYSTGSPAPPSAPIPLTVGTVLMNIGGNMFTLDGRHVDAIGYTVSVSNGRGTTFTIGNSCAYPNPSILSLLSGDFCLFSDIVPLVGDPGDANIISEGFTVNGVPATEFDPSMGVGQYEIVYTVDGGIPKSFGPNDPGCVQSVKVFVNVVMTPATLNCNDHIYISLPASCTGEIMPDDVLEGTYGCYDDYIVELDKTAPFGNGPWLPATLTAADIGKTYQTRVTHLVSGNKCWGLVTIEDKLEPKMECKSFHLICPITNYDPAYLANVLGIAEANPIVTDCSNFTLTHTDTWFDLACGESVNGMQDISAYVRRRWTATDAWGNSTTCMQYIYFDRRHVSDVIFPADYEVSCSGNLNFDPSVTGSPYVTGFNMQWPLNPGAGFCEMQSAYVDQILPVCDGTYKILRTWTVLDWCLPVSPTPPFTNPLYYIQLIKIVDDAGPAFTCPPTTIVSIDPFACCATVDLPDLIIEDVCSRVNNIEAMIATFDPFTGAPTGMYTVGGTLTDFPGNNYWDRDTMGNWGITPCLPIGTQIVTYSAQDDCSNVSTCTFKLTIRDLIPPVAACDQFTQVSLGNSGVAVVNASTFDDGSYDICCLDGFKAGKMGGGLGATVEFNCNDVGDTITVVFRVEDCSGNTNDCMVSVVVDDKIKPVCQSPANVTVSCEQFDPSLWIYGKAAVADNCCLDDTKEYQGQEGLTHTVSYSNFDTLCNKGTINRTFRAFDCYGNSSQCTQRIVVNYEQDYFVKFPNDVIVSVCDGTGNYGEPSFFGEDCELLGISYEDEIFTVVPDACFKIERTWKIINWCTYDPNLPCVIVPNPNPNAIANHPSNLPGPIVSPIQTSGDPWKSTIVKITPTASSTNYSIFYDPNANCYVYKQIIKIIDTEDPIIDCPASPVTICDVTPNDPLLWNASYWWDNNNQSHDLCEAPSDICITATDLCSGANINIEYQLFLDLDGDGIMETVVNSTQLGSQPGGLGWNNILFGNFTGAGQPRQFDGRPVAANQKWGFAIEETVTGNNKTACVKFNTQGSQTSYVTPQLPHGTHKIKWFVSDGCGNDAVCEYTIIIKDCKAPTVVCLNGLSVNIMPTGMIQLWATDFLQYTEDNCTLTPWLKLGIRKSADMGTGFPVDAQGNPITNVTFDCTELGLQQVELWSIDLAGNADYCETYVLVQDNNGNCSPNGSLMVSGALKTEPGSDKAIEEVVTELLVFSPAGGNSILNQLSQNTGLYSFNAIPAGSDVTITPTKDDNPLNGVTTYDLVLISKHILGIAPLGSPYKMIAADANRSNSITTFDIVELRKLILGIYQELPSNTSWRFVDQGFSFANPLNPFQAPFPENKFFGNMQVSAMAEDFVGVKIGDVNNTVVANSLMVSDDRSVGILLFDVSSPTPTLPEGEGVLAGSEFELTFRADQKTLGYQMTLNLKGLEVVEIVENNNVTASNFGILGDALTVSIDNSDVFTVKFRATKSGKLSEMLQVSSRITKAEGYVPAEASAKEGEVQNERLDVALRFDGRKIAGVGFELYQNQPNPFVNKTFIGFHLPEASAATLTVYDETGRVVYTQKGDFAKGYNAISLDRALLNTTGVLYYTLETATDAATMKMIQAR